MFIIIYKFKFITRYYSFFSISFICLIQYSYLLLDHTYIHICQRAYTLQYMSHWKIECIDNLFICESIFIYLFWIFQSSNNKCWTGCHWNYKQMELLMLKYKNQESLNINMEWITFIFKILFGTLDLKKKKKKDICV